MKKAFSTWYNYVIALALVGLVSLIAILPYFVPIYSFEWPAPFISYTYMFAGVVIFGIGFIIQDLYRARVRHKTRNWNNPLEEANLNTAWAIFCPALVAGIVNLAGGAILSLFLR